MVSLQTSLEHEAGSERGTNWNPPPPYFVALCVHAAHMYVCGSQGVLLRPWVELPGMFGSIWPLHAALPTVELAAPDFLILQCEGLTRPSLCPLWLVVEQTPQALC